MVFFPLNSLQGFLEIKAVTSAIILGKEIYSVDLASKINQNFLHSINSLPPLSQLENVEIDPPVRNETERKYFIPPEVVHSKLSNFKRSKAPGLDNIPSWISKDFAMELSSPIADIFNASIQETCVPDSWKKANVIPIPKVDVVKEIENDLRPISLTPILSKTIEHFVGEWIVSRIRHLIVRKQFGSLSDLFTTHAL